MCTHDVDIRKYSEYTKRFVPCPLMHMCPLACPIPCKNVQDLAIQNGLSGFSEMPSCGVQAVVNCICMNVYNLDSYQMLSCENMSLFQQCRQGRLKVIQPKNDKFKNFFIQHEDTFQAAWSILSHSISDKPSLGSVMIPTYTQTLLFFLIVPLSLPPLFPFWTMLC